MTSGSLRQSADVPDSLRERLHAYSLAAGAAGVTMLALAPPSAAEIVYTPINVNIGPNGTYALDLNGDGAIDFNIQAVYRSNSGVYIGYLSAEPALPGNAVASAAGKFSGYAAALQYGPRIGPQRKHWRSYPNYAPMARGHISSSPFRSTCRGPWKNRQNRYLGLKFKIGNEIHFGWARMSNDCHGGNNSAVLTGYAYETIANRAIKAGREQGTDDGVDQPDTPNASAAVPATLGMLSRGAPGLRAWRREGQSPAAKLENQ